MNYKFFNFKYFLYILIRYMGGSRLKIVWKILNARVHMSGPIVESKFFVNDKLSIYTSLLKPSQE